MNKRLKKAVNKLETERFNFMLTPWGSLIESCLKVTGKKITNGEYIKRLKHARLPYLDDPEFLPKTFEAMGLDIADFKGITIGLYRDEKFGSAVFHPVCPVKVTGEDGEKEVITPAPIRKDFLPQTVVRNWEKVELIKL